MSNGQSSSKRPIPARVRSAGILLHVTSLPGKFGVGDLGPAAHAFVESLARARQTWWQILPLSPPGDCGSPYQSLSAFAGNPSLISPDALFRDGLLRRSDVAAQDFPEGKVDHARVAIFKSHILTLAWERFAAGAAKPLRDEFERFHRQQSAWLDDVALFVALKDVNGDKPWTDWDKPLVQRRKGALAAARKELAGRVERHQFVQFLFSRQLNALRRHAKQLGVKLLGDLPIFVSADSADVWANPHLFLLDRERRPKVVAGVPPDYFSETGQRWGNPLYDWRAMKRDGFAWWVARLRAALAQVDMIRIDHFRGFEAYWEIKAHHPTAKEGRWVKAPGAELFRTLRKELGDLPLVAEDLGLITPEVAALRESFGLPGMKVLQFAFGGSSDNPFLPHNYERNTVAYTGTHDNDTTVGWFKSLRSEERRRVRNYLPRGEQDIALAFIRLAWASVADVAIAPLQDLLRLGSQARMNLPGTVKGNWGWRLKPGMLKNALLDRLGEMTETYGRASMPPRA